MAKLADTANPATRSASIGTDLETSGVTAPASRFLVCAADLPRLQGGLPKLLVHAKASLSMIKEFLSPSLLLVRVDYDAAARLFTLFIDPSHDRETAVLPFKTSEFLPLTCIPTNVLALWAFDKSQATALQMFADWAESEYASPLLSLQTGDSESLKTYLLNQMLGGASDAEQRNIRLQNALTLLRQEHEETRQTLFRMQELLQNIHQHPVQLTFSTHPGRHTLSPPQRADSEGHVVIQSLPLAGRGLAGLDIFIAETTEERGFLLCTLLDTATGSRVGRWTVEYAQIRRGWLNFSLPTILDENFHALELHLEFHDIGKRHPKLALTEDRLGQQPNLRLNGLVEEGMLALRIWAGYPGLRNESAASNILWLDEKRFFEYVLPESLLASVRKTVKELSDFDYLVLHPSGELLLHPLQGKEVSAYIPHALPRGATHVEATVSVNGPCPSPVEFSLVAVPSDMEPSYVSGDGKGGIASTGWVRALKTFTRQTLTLRFDEPSKSTALDLYLFTRVPGNASVDFCQALFHRFVIGIDAQKASFLRSHPEADFSERRNATPNLPLPRSTQTIALELNETQAIEPLKQFDVPFDYVKRVGNETILVHPILGETNIAKLPLAVPPHCVNIYADIVVDNPECHSEIAFAIAIDHANASDPDQMRLSDWQYISLPCTRHTILLPVEDSHTAPRHLYLLTQAPGAQTVDFANAYFLNIRFEVEKLPAASITAV